MNFSPLSLPLLSLLLQLEVKCLSQQEEMEELEERLQKEKNTTASLQEELNKKITEVGKIAVK